MISYLIQTHLFLWTFAALHTFLAGHAVKSRLQAHMGNYSHWYRLLYNLFNLGATAVFFLWFWPGDTVLFRVPLPWSIPLILLLIAGLVLITWILVICFDPWEFLGLRQAVTGQSTPTPPLKTDGPFRLCRHPLYLGAVLAVGCNPRVSVLGLSMTVFVLLYGILGSIPEERKLSARYGSPYDAYRARTKRLIPGLF